jgi:hypothetical protein
VIVSTAAEFRLAAASNSDRPTVAGIAYSFWSKSNSDDLETAAATFNRPPVTVRPANEAVGTAVSKIAERISAPLTARPWAAA